MRPTARLLVATAAVALAVVGPSVPAAAATCTYTSGTNLVAVETTAGETVTIARNVDAITVNGTACAEATVANTDLVTVTAVGGEPQEVVIDQSGGRFEPGATPEPDGASEIEFTIALATGTPGLRIVGAADADTIVVGADGINLNGAEATGDADVTISADTPLLVIQGGDGADTLSVGGGAGTGVAGPGAGLQGQAGDDLFLPGIAASGFDGGEGTDTIDLGTANGVQVDLGAGRIDGVGSGTIGAVENVTGSPGNDELIGDDADNVLAGGDGDDLVDGGRGNDTLLGGEGNDTVSFASVNQGVEADLRAGEAAGAGDDTLGGFEHAVGSGKADVLRGTTGKNTLDGGKGRDEIHGGNGADELLGGEGNDRLFGDKGKDHLKGEQGRDQLSGGDGRDRCQGGPDPDAFVFCERLS
jgi:Ca2+-binding RTX toxin-like protein